MTTSAPTLENTVTDGQIFDVAPCFDTEKGRSYLIVHFYGFVEIDGRKIMAQREGHEDTYRALYGKERLDAYGTDSK